MYNLLKGSLINLELTLATEPKNVGVTLLTEDGNEEPISKIGLNTFEFRRLLDHEFKAVIRLRDLDAPSREPVDSESITFSPIPDEPPVVEITDPAKDLQLHQMLVFYLSIFPMIMGVADVRINISHAGEKEEETIFVDPVEKEKTISYVLDLVIWHLRLAM